MMRRKEIVLICFIASLFVFGGKRANSQDVRVSTDPDTATILIGDQIWFSVLIEKPVGLKVEHSRLRDTIKKDIEIIRGPVTDSARIPGDRVVVRDRYLITSFDTGRYEIPPFYAEIVSDEGIKRFYSDYSYLSVRRTDISPKDTTMQFFDIIPPYRAPITQEEALPWVLITVALALLVYLLIKYLKSRRREDQGNLTEDPVEAAHILAYRRLERLKGEKLWQKGEFKEYYTRLTEILRVYLDMRFSMNSMESTTSEILLEIANYRVTEGEASDSLKQVLELADMVKFAKFTPDSSDCELSMEMAWSFISMTRKEKLPLKDNDTSGQKEGGDGE